MARSEHGLDHLERVSLYALATLPADETALVEAQLAECAECRMELETLEPIGDALVSWPVDVLRPPTRLWHRLAGRVASESGQAPLCEPIREWVEPEWEAVAPGIAVKLLATDLTTRSVSMLVRLDPNTDYPPHQHNGVEELHLLHGELWINDRKLDPGDYSVADPGTVDSRVWSETGCTCVLIASAADILR